MSDLKGVGLGLVTRELDETDVRILEGLSILGPRNLTLIAEHLDMPSTTVRYRFNRMVVDKILFLHAVPYYKNLGLKKAVVFVEAVLGYEDLLLDCLRVNGFWQYISRIYSPYVGYAGIWTVPKNNASDFHLFLWKLVDLGVAKSFELNWTTCHMGVPIRSKWFNAVEKRWIFKWDEWVNEVESIEGDLSDTLRDPDDYTMNFDTEDLLIIKELHKNGSSTKTDISRAIGIPLEGVKYHIRKHILKRDLIEGYQVEVARYHPLSSESLFIKCEFDDYDQLVKFAISLRNKPFPIHISKVIGKNALIVHINLPKEEFRGLINALSALIRRGLLKTYRYWIQDIFVQFNATIPFQHYNSNGWKYNFNEQKEALEKLVKKCISFNHINKTS